jgi:hypothetical protein
MNPLTAPLLMGMDLRRQFPLRLDPDLHAEAADEATLRQISQTRFGAWVFRQILRLEFLSLENREFIRVIAAELGRPFTALDVIDGLVSAARRATREGKLRPGFWPAQAIKLGFFGAK